MLSNLPPGVLESDLPDNRPEDQEFEFHIIMTQGQIQDLFDWIDKRQRNQIANQSALFILKDLYDQIKDEYLSKIPPQTDIDEDGNIIKL